MGINLSLSRLKASDGTAPPGPNVTIQVRFLLSAEEAAALDALPGNVAFAVRRIVQAHLSGSTWLLLSEVQRAAILAYTRAAPNGAPNGAAEAAWERVVAAFQRLPVSPERDALANELAACSWAEANQVGVLRVAFGLDPKDGETLLAGRG